VKNKEKAYCKRILCLITVCALALGNISFAFAAPKQHYKDIYADMSTEEQRELIKYLRQFGIEELHILGHVLDDFDGVATEEVLNWCSSFYPYEVDGYDEEFGLGIFCYGGGGFPAENIDKMLKDTFGLDNGRNVKGENAWYSEGNYYISFNSASVEDSCGIQPVLMYNIGKDLYYVQFEQYHTADCLYNNNRYRDFESNNLGERLTEMEEIMPFDFSTPKSKWKVADLTQYRKVANSLPESYNCLNTGYAIIKKNGASYQLLKWNIEGEKLSDAELDAFRKSVEPQIDLTIDYKPVSKFTTADEYVTYLKKNLTTLQEGQPSDEAIAEITKYVEFAIENASTTKIDTEKKTVKITKKLVQQAVKKAQQAKLKLDNLLLEYDITPNKSLHTVIKFNAAGTNVESGVKIEFEDGVGEELNRINGLRVVLDPQYHGLYVETENLKGLNDKSDCNLVEFKKNKEKYTIVFLDSKKKTIDKVDYPMMFAIPAPSEFSSVMAEYNGGSDNWGGQYDSSNKTLEFMTNYSGNYSVLEKSIEISDISALTEQQQQAIRFMVSKGYFDLEGKAFKPNDILSRYDFESALVKMFFALDREANSAFKDMTKNNKYYPYVASAEKMNIAKGFEDGTFKGERFTNKQEVIAFCARTLADKKGYTYPEDLDKYLKFEDKATIDNWAKEDIALAVKSGLIEGEGQLNPKSDITKAESAEILYKLFMLLYDTSPASMAAEEAEQKSHALAIVAGVVGVGAIGGASIWWARRKRLINKKLI